jgi:hypothetical protein
MKCIVCESGSEKYFDKTYFESPVNINLKVSYRKCTKCGFVFSETHQTMPKNEWEELNDKFHHGIEQKQQNRLFNQPPYIDIALALHVLHDNGVISLKKALDYAAGYGTLANVLQKYFSHKISVYDEFISADVVYKNEGLLSDKYETVINTAMFEHVTNRTSLDRVAALVKENGSLIIHTFVSENIPCDPNWFYLEFIVHFLQITA